MAHYGHNGQPDFPLGFQSELFNNNLPSDDPLQSLNQQGVLDQYERSRLNDFFANPDQLNFEDIDFFNMNPDQKIDNTNFEQLQQPQPMNGSTTDDMLGAELVMGLSASQGRNPAHVASSTHSGSWGSMHGVHYTGAIRPASSLQTPFTSSSGPTTGAMYATGLQNYGGSVNQPPDPFMWSPSQARNLSLQTNLQQYSNPQYTQSAFPPPHRRSGPNFPQGFGSDPNFNTHGYCGPNYLTREQEKAGNLLPVPFMDQLVQSGPTHVNRNGPPSNMSHKQQPRHSLPAASAAFHSANSSPGGGLGGLPINTPMSAIRPTNRPWPRNHGHGTVEDAGNDDEIEVAHPQPRKRRKSAMEREDEAEYMPGGKRGPKVPKAEAEDASDDEDADLKTLKRKAPPKRRKSAPAGRAVTVSNASSPPEDDMSPASGEPLSSKKKGRGGGNRHNLSEAQKRENHILSEQKRRDVIRNGYAALDELVPVLAEGKAGLSKADILKETVAFLREIVATNNQMSELLGVPLQHINADADADADAEAEEEEEDYGDPE